MFETGRRGRRKRRRRRRRRFVVPRPGTTLSHLVINVLFGTGSHFNVSFQQFCLIS
jgi:hypothetical protein